MSDGDAGVPVDDEHSSEKSPPPEAPAYEPPRILKKRSVAGVTLASEGMPGPAGSQFPVSG